MNADPLEKKDSALILRGVSTWHDVRLEAAGVRAYMENSRLRYFDAYVALQTVYLKFISHCFV